MLCTYMVVFGEASPQLIELELDEAGAVMEILHDKGVHPPPHRAFCEGCRFNASPPVPRREPAARR